ncbi:hypothetical protein SL1157_0479 [Ruegeria lacuscaerulensis ITI-1157]|nr:hypothetical protein SL1157_0479 [Ruegeria lacuscaerulensis ITI-1157]
MTGDGLTIISVEWVNTGDRLILALPQRIGQAVFSSIIMSAVCRILFLECVEYTPLEYV